MGQPRTQKMFKKSMYWSRHGKHAKVDPYYYVNERKRRPDGTLYGSIQDLFKAERSKR